MIWILMTLLLGPSASVDTEYKKEIDDWHAGRMERLHRPEGWLSLVGLHRLPEGDHTVGSAEGADVQLVGQAPAEVGVIHVADGRARLELAEGVDLRVSGEAVQSPVPLFTDQDDSTTVCELGSLRFYAIERSEKLLLRVKDRQSDLIAQVDHIDRYPVDPKWRIKAQWKPYEPAKSIRVADVLGNVYDEELEGYLEFQVEGESYTMDPLPSGDEYFLIFSDATSGEETYGAGRYIYVPVKDEEGTVWIDFNRAYNMPCVFTPFATCSLPPDGNDYPFAVTAGEKMWGEHH